MHLAVTETNPARALYERLGFREAPAAYTVKTAPSTATSTGPPKAFSASR